MDHSYVVTGSCYALRPVNNSDASRIVELRTDSQRSLYLNRISPDIQGQLQWLSEYYKRSGDYYFAVERLSDKKVEGFISLYDIEDKTAIGEFGRWIIDEKSNSALESVYLLYKFSFEILNLKTVFCRTLIDNVKVVSLHNSYGAREAGVLEGEFRIDGVPRTAIKHEVLAADWSVVSLKLKRYIDFLARKMIK